MKLDVCVAVDNLLLILFNLSLYVSIFLLKFLEQSKGLINNRTLLYF